MCCGTGGQASNPYFQFENYLRVSPNFLHLFARFRTLNHRLPIQTGRFNYIPRCERLCNKCDLLDIGDEFHYILKCPYFAEKKCIHKSYLKNTNVMKFNNLFCNTNRRVLLNIAYFVKLILNEF